jgi:hypothetical protein
LRGPYASIPASAPMLAASRDHQRDTTGSMERVCRRQNVVCPFVCVTVWAQEEGREDSVQS